MTIQMVARKRDGEWRGATVLDTVFQDAMVDASLANILGESIGAIISQDFPDGSMITVTVAVESRRDDA